MSKFGKILTLDEATRLDVVSSTVTYVGKALPNSATSAVVWKITRLTSTAEGDLTIEYVTGSPVYTSIWDDRATLAFDKREKAYLEKTSKASNELEKKQAELQAYEDSVKAREEEVQKKLDVIKSLG